MCEECSEAMDIAREIQAKDGRVTPEKHWKILNSTEGLEYTMKVGRMCEILSECQRTPEFLGKEGTYHLAVLTNMRAITDTIIRI